MPFFYPQVWLLGVTEAEHEYTECACGINGFTETPKSYVAFEDIYYVSHVMEKSTNTNNAGIRKQSKKSVGETQLMIDTLSINTSVEFHRLWGTFKSVSPHLCFFVSSKRVPYLSFCPSHPCSAWLPSIKLWCVCVCVYGLNLCLLTWWYPDKKNKKYSGDTNVSAYK